MAAQPVKQRARVGPTQGSGVKLDCDDDGNYGEQGSCAVPGRWRQGLKGQSFDKRLGFALRGLRLALQREKSLRTHLLAVLAVLLALLASHAPPLWWAILGLTAGMVLVAEMINSAFETLIDHLHPEQHPEIGAAKDIAAGAVLVASGVALAVGVAFVLDWVMA